MESLQLKAIFPVTPEVVYRAWLNSTAHTQMTGGTAQCSDRVDAPFSVWEGYITGKNLELVPNTRIVQSWRTTEFSTGDDDSNLVLDFKAVSEGTELTLTHTHIPKGQTQYKQGWVDHYLTPMLEYFQTLAEN